MSSSSSFFIDDECGVATRNLSDDDEMMSQEDDVSTPDFITEKDLIGLEEDDLKEKTRLLVWQEMHAIMPATCYGAKMYVVHLACLFISTYAEKQWEDAHADFERIYEIDHSVWEAFPVFFLKKAFSTAQDAWSGKVIDDSVWSRLWFIGGMDVTQCDQ